jgi:tetratricopeptide (TPR) repeat protein
MDETANALLQRARQARKGYRTEDARRDLAAANELFRHGGPQTELARALTELGRLERDLLHYDSARENYEGAAEIYRAQADALKLTHTIRHVGDILRNAGRGSLAEPYHKEALDIYRRDERTLPMDLANVIRGLALLKADAGAVEESRALWSEARDLHSAVGVKEGVAECDRQLTRLGP